MTPLFFVPALRERIGKPDFFAHYGALLIRAFAVLFALAALIGWFQVWKRVFDMQGAAILGGVLFQLCFVIGAYMVLHVLWLRADDTAATDTSDYAVIPILPVFLKMLGEVYASLAVISGMAAGLLQLFVDNSRLADRTFGDVPGIGWGHAFLIEMMGGRDGISSFINAVLLAAGGLITAVIWLAFFYLLAEAVTLMLNIAKDLRRCG